MSLHKLLVAENGSEVLSAATENLNERPAADHLSNHHKHNNRKEHGDPKFIVDLFEEPEDNDIIYLNEEVKFNDSLSFIAVGNSGYPPPCNFSRDRATAAIEPISLPIDVPFPLKSLGVVPQKSNNFRIPLTVKDKEHQQIEDEENRDPRGVKTNNRKIEKREAARYREERRRKLAKQNEADRRRAQNERISRLDADQPEFDQLSRELEEDYQAEFERRAVERRSTIHQYLQPEFKKGRHQVEPNRSSVKAEHVSSVVEYHPTPVSVGIKTFVSTGTQTSPRNSVHDSMTALRYSEVASFIDAHISAAIQRIPQPFNVHNQLGPSVTSSQIAERERGSTPSQPQLNQVTISRSEYDNLKKKKKKKNKLSHGQRNRLKKAIERQVREECAKIEEYKTKK